MGGKNKKMEREVERRTKLGVERVGERSHLRGETRTKLGVERVGERSQLRGETKTPKVVKGITRVVKIRRTRVVNQRRRVENQRSQAQNKTQRKSGKVQPAGDKRTACSRAVNSTCLDTAVKLLKIVNSRVTNFLIQQKRMSKYNSTGGKKSGKKGLFGPIASKVIDVGGGNASDLSCSGNKTNVGATKLKSIISSLQTCEE